MEVYDTADLIAVAQQLINSLPAKTKIANRNGYNTLKLRTSNTDRSYCLVVWAVHDVLSEVSKLATRHQLVVGIDVTHVLQEACAKQH